MKLLHHFMLGINIPLHFRKTFFALSKNIFMAVLALTLVALINQVNLIVNLGVKSHDLHMKILNMCLHMMPYFISILTPFAVLMGTLVFLYKCRKENYILALQNCGLEPSKIYRPFYVVVIIVVLINHCTYFFIAPYSHYNFRTIQLELQQKHFADFIETGLLRSYASGLTMYIDKQENGMFKDIFIHDTRQKNLTRTFTAKLGQVNINNEGVNLRLYNGCYQQVADHNPFMLHFKSYTLFINTPGKAEASSGAPDPQSMSLSDLINFDDKNSRIASKFRTTLHQKIIWPLYALIFMILCLKSDWHFNYENYSRIYRPISLWVSVGACFILSIINFLLQSIGSLGILIYLTPIFLLQIALQMIQSTAKKFK